MPFQAIRTILKNLKSAKNYRYLKSLHHEDDFVYFNGQKLLNLAGNDYLALAKNEALKEEFFKHLKQKDCYFSSSSSRSLSGNFSIYEDFENDLAAKINENLKPKDKKEVLHFNSGYQLNLSCIQALSSVPNTLFISDKLIHASIIDGLRLGGKKFLRFKHNDMSHLQDLLEKQYKKYDFIIVISEALFSMNGDFAPLQRLVALKKQYKNILLYIDEAHSVGCFDEKGLGLVNSLNLVQEIDFLVFTFGKALASMGACMICAEDFKNFFINKSRAFIYSTALPPLNVAWTHFICGKLAFFTKERRRLFFISDFFKTMLENKGFEVLGNAYIISLLCNSNERADELSLRLLKKGFFAPAIKEPTVPKNTARIRFSLSANIKEEDLIRLGEVI